MSRLCCTLLGAACVLSGCATKAVEDTGIGVAPQLPQAQSQRFPTVDIAPATGWPDGAAPTPAPGLRVNAFALNLSHPRWLYVLPNGDVLVAESNAPAGKSGMRGLKGWVQKQVARKAGAGAVSADRITLLRDADGDGTAEIRTVYLKGLTSPFGMALVRDMLYIANADALVSVRYLTGETQASQAPQMVVPLPGGAGQLNHHWTKSLLAAPDGKHLYVGVGSNSNVAENGFAAEESRAAILQVDTVAKTTRIFASGLRNPVGMDWEPTTKTLWTVVNERDELGNNLVPDYLTSVKEGGFYGWPWSYWGAHVDKRVSPSNPGKVAAAIRPDYGLGNHVAPLGLAFSRADALDGAYGEGALIGLHGSWNRKPPTGYKVVFVPFADGKPAGAPRDVLTGFLDAQGNARGRPVGVALAKNGGVLVADDVGNAVWRISATR